MQEQVHSLARRGLNAIWVGSTSVVVAGLQLILLAFMARVFADEKMSAMFLVIAAIGVLEIAADYGLRIVAVKRLVPESKVAGEFMLILFSKVFVAVLLFIVVMTTGISGLDPMSVVMVLAISITQPNSDPFIWYLRSIERMDREAVFVVSSRILLTVVLLIEAYIDCSLNTLLASWVMINLARLVWEYLSGNLSEIRRRISGELVFLNTAAVYGLLREMAPIGTAFMLAALLARAPVLIMGFDAQPASEINYIGAALNILSGGMIISTAVVIAGFPALSRAVHEQDWRCADLILREGVGRIGIIVVPATLVGIYMSPWLLSLLFGEMYIVASNLLVTMLIGLYISSINFMLKYLLNSMGQNWRDTLSVLSGLVVFLVMFNMPFYTGAMAAAVAWVVAEYAILVARLIIVRRRCSQVRAPVAMILSPAFLVLVVGVLI